MLRTSLSGIVSPEQFDAADVCPTARPEELGVDAWVRLEQPGHRSLTTVTPPADGPPA